MKQERGRTENDKPIRVLHIVGAIYPGGLENFIMNLYEKIDKEKFQFDVAVHLRKENDYTEKIRAMGGEVYELPRLTKAPLRSLQQLYRLVRRNQYPIVIRHTANALVAPQLLVSRLAGARTICHSHNETDPQKLLHKLGRILMNVSVCDRIACSDKAGKWMFGKKDFKLVHNAIDIEKFTYSAQKEERIRKEFQLGNKKVYGHIANFIESKNHGYLLRIFQELSELDKEAVFFCLGEGESRPEIEEEIKRLKLQDKVILTGIRKDVEDFMSCFDVLIFPSVFEGLPLTLIEAQAAGLPCLISDTITKEVVVTEGLVEYLSIQEEPVKWAEKVVTMLSKEPKEKTRRCQLYSIKDAGYDMNTLAEWYEAYFFQIKEGKR